MGGTIPLDVILLAPAEADESTAEPVADEEDDWADDDGFFDDAFGIDFGFGAEETTQTGYWFSLPGRQILDEVHRIIEDRNESGKVLSLSTAFEVMDGLYGGKLGGVELALVENSLPDDVNSALVAPFYFAEEQEARLSVESWRLVSHSAVTLICGSCEKTYYCRRVLRLSVYISPRYWCFITMCCKACFSRKL